MEHSPTAGEMDCLSDLPVHVLLHILSFLPSKLAARTSPLSRSFHRRWETSPVLDLDLSDFEHGICSDFVDLASRTLLHRNPPSPLQSLCLRLRKYVWFDVNLLTSSYISSLLDKAGSLGLRYLTVQLDYGMVPTVLPLILSLCCLESLSLNRDIASPQEPLISSPISLTHLKSLSIYTECLDNDALNQLISQLNALEDLNLTWIGCAGGVHLKSVTVKRLKLVLMAII